MMCEKRGKEARRPSDNSDAELSTQRRSANRRVGLHQQFIKASLPVKINTPLPTGSPTAPPMCLRPSCDYHLVRCALRIRLFRLLRFQGCCHLNRTGSACSTSSCWMCFLHSSAHLNFQSYLWKAAAAAGCSLKLKTMSAPVRSHLPVWAHFNQQHNDKQSGARQQIEGGYQKAGDSVDLGSSRTTAPVSVETESCSGLSAGCRASPWYFQHPCVGAADC